MDKIVEMNWKAIDASVAAIEEVTVPDSVGKAYVPAELLPADASDFAKDVILPSMLQKGDDVPVSKMTFDGSLPTATTKLKNGVLLRAFRNGISDNCIQCNQCVMACPHAVIRAKQIDPANLADAPESFNTVKSKTKNDKDLDYKIQVYVRRLYRLRRLC